MDDEYYMQLAYNEALKAKNFDEVPIGSIIVRDGEILACAFNQKETKKDVTAHAEILAIQEACKKTNSWHLDGCTIYSTLEPCIMCSGAIIQSRISKVVYGAKGQRWHGISEYLSQHEFNHYPEIISGVLEEKCCNLLSNYFKEKRKKKNIC